MNHTDNYLPADTLAASQPITNPTLIAQLIEADTQAQENQPMNDTTKEETPQLGDEIASLGLALFSSLMPLINRMVEQKFAEMVDSAKTLNMLNETMEAKISEQIAHAINQHEYTYDHDDYDRYDRRIDELESQLEGLPSEDKFEKMVKRAANDALEEFDLDEKISDALDNYDMSSKIDDALSDREDIVTVDGLAEALRHVSIKMMG